jgi:hypothetical protein
MPTDHSKHTSSARTRALLSASIALCGSATVLLGYSRGADAHAAKLPHVPPGAHALMANAPGQNEGGRIPKLDAMLANEGYDATRERENLAAFRSALDGDPSAEHLALACGRSFCRLQIDRLPGIGMPWQQIDAAIRPAIAGELIFQTDAEGHHGYVYFSLPDTKLPL